MSPPTHEVATLGDFARFDGKAEWIAGRIVPLPALGDYPALIAGRLQRGLFVYAEASGRGDVHEGKLAYIVPELTSGRRSFSPDVSYFVGTPPSNPMSFPEGPPIFAVEVRSEASYTDEAGRAAKRADYFEAGTLVVRDVDPIVECVHVYRAGAPDRPETLRRGREADAEPAVPGWRISLEQLFSPRQHGAH